MSRRRPDGTAAPLPRDWLPDAQPADDDAGWDAAVRRVVSAAEPGLGVIGMPLAGEARWWSQLGRWWVPSAGLAAAAAALLLLVLPGERVRPSATASLALNVIAAEGDPAALWEGFGIEADPVLALIALQTRGR